ncbi:MAG TPA: hypothetical protein PKB10_10110 [Tepidisphaeraceae bacterium]|nr:hypothetical protein [Tepidisphaeraceae bacterium]
MRSPACTTTRRAPAMVEHLESRQHLSADVPVSLPGTVFDGTWGGPTPDRFDSGFLWAAPHLFSPEPGVMDYSEWRVRNIAAWAREGGMNWRTDVGTPKKFVVIDVERMDHTSPPAWIAQVRDVVTWFKDEAPNVAIGLYGFTPHEAFWWRDLYSAPTEARTRSIREGFAAVRPVFERIDAIVQDVYMLGPDRINADLAYMRGFAWHAREQYPHLPVVAWTWGAYHEAWNPAGSVLGNNVARRYVSTAWQNYDAIVAWGTHSDNARWKGVLATLKNWRVNVDYSLHRSPSLVQVFPSETTIYRLNVWAEVLR